MAASGGGVVVHQRPAAEAAAGAWTERQLRRAKPLELPSQAREAGAPAAGTDSSREPRYLDGRDPLAAAAGFNRFTSNAVPEPTAYPNSTNGKLYGRFPGGGAYTCSASVVRSDNRSVIFTAGHCVKDPGPNGRFGKNLTFVPAYTEGDAPYGEWSWDAVYVKGAWSRKGNSNFDYATIALRESEGRRVEDTVGSLGFAYNLPNRQTYRAVGYPANKRDSEVMWECNSSLGGRDPFHRRPGPAAIGIGCNMGSGASGGGWAIAGNRLASVTSFSYDGLRNQLYGPRLTAKAEKLRTRAGRRNVS